MKKMFEIFDGLLALLPGDGAKTVVGAGVLALLPQIMANPTFASLLAPVSPLVDGVATTLVGLGLVHKAIKGILAKLK